MLRDALRNTGNTMLNQRRFSNSGTGSVRNGSSWIGFIFRRNEKELTTALRGRQVRNRVLDHLLPLLWLGRVDAGIDYLRTLGAYTLKTGQSVDLL